MQIYTSFSAVKSRPKSQSLLETANSAQIPMDSNLAYQSHHKRQRETSAEEGDQRYGGLAKRDEVIYDHPIL